MAVPICTADVGRPFVSKLELMLLSEGIIYCETELKRALRCKFDVDSVSVGFEIDI